VSMMSESLKRAVVLASAALAMAWAVAQVGEGPPSGASSAPATSQPAAPQGEATPTPPAAAPTTAAQAPDGIQDLSSAEVEAELKNLEQVLSGKPDAGERAAAKPLPADLGVPLPSDI